MLKMAMALVVAATATGAAQASGTWDDIVANVFDDRPMEASGVVSIDAPYRAEDAATVPIGLSFALPEADSRHVERVTLVIDENPAPVAATFEFGAEAGVSTLETRVRIESYSDVHAVAELSDGSLHVAQEFVKASGGCAAPMAKDPEQALVDLGRMKLRRLGPGETGRPEAQLMIRHPNNSGLQMDQLTRFYIPAHFVHSLSVRQGDEPLLSMEGGISISEDPSFRFDYTPNGQPIRVEVEDTEGGVFRSEWPAEPDA